MPESNVKWQPDGVGSLCRIGALIPDSDPVPESEMWAMSPEGVSIHAARVPWSRKAGDFATLPPLYNAVDQLTELAPKAIIFSFTSSSYVLGVDAEAATRAYLDQRSGGIPVISPCFAAVEALRLSGAKRVALIHPPWFSDETNEKGKEYFCTQGFDVVACQQVRPARQFTEVHPEEVYQQVCTIAPPNADAVFIGGNGMRAVGTIRALEAALQRPVLTANQIALWAALRVAGVAVKITDYGRIFSTIAAGRRPC